MTALLYIFAGIGALVVVLILSFVCSWLFVHAVARAQIRRQVQAARVDTDASPITGPPSSPILNHHE
jgi:hypothetical protein